MARPISRAFLLNLLIIVAIIIFATFLFHCSEGFTGGSKDYYAKLGSVVTIPASDLNGKTLNDIQYQVWKGNSWLPLANTLSAGKTLASVVDTSSGINYTISGAGKTVLKASTNTMPLLAKQVKMPISGNDPSLVSGITINNLSTSTIPSTGSGDPANGNAQVKITAVFA